MTVTEYILSSKLTKLSLLELEELSIGMVLEHFDLYSQTMNPDKEEEVKRATQEDIQKFKGR